MTPIPEPELAVGVATEPRSYGATELRDEDETSVRRVDRVSLVSEVRRLSALRPWIWSAAVAMQWLIIAAAFGAALVLDSWWAYVIAGLVVATRQHALGVLMHEAVHHRAFANRQLADAVSDMTCALPIGVSTHVYRHFHFLHHRNVSTDLDPDWTSAIGDHDWIWPKPMWACASVFIRDVTGLNARMLGHYIMQWSPYPRLAWPPTELLRQPRLRMQDRILTCVFGAGLVCALVLVPGFWFYYLVLWLLPQFTALTAIFRIRALAEHYCLPGHDELTHTRTVVPSMADRCLISPCGINYHLEHHLFPSVPFYNLAELHQLLMKTEEFARHASLTDGYLFGRRSLLAELTGRHRPYA